MLVDSVSLAPGARGGAGGVGAVEGGGDEEGSRFSSACFVQGRESSAFFQMSAGEEICEGRARPRGGGARLCGALVTKR